MARSRDQYIPRLYSDDTRESEPFDTAEDAWFWFIAAQQARNDGARFSAGQSLTPRPCEPSDILKVLDRLYRNRRVTLDHVMVLRHYGRRGAPPDLRHYKEARAARLWHESMERLGDALILKNIVRRPIPQRNEAWFTDAQIYEATP